MNFYNRSSLGTEANVLERDNVVYWKTKRKIKNDLQCACLCLHVGLIDSGLVRSRVVITPPIKDIKSRITP